jgi:hypothetical protein
MNSKLLVLPILASAVCAQVKWPNELAVWFADGTGILIHTESSGGNPMSSTTGSVASWGKDSHRVVLGKNGEILFGYDIEARKAGEGTFSVRIKPSREAIRMTCCTNGKSTYEYMPTVAAVRDFPPLRAGDAVQVEILQNPTTGEKVYDVLKVLPGRPAPAVRNAPFASSFSLRDVRVSIEGRTIVEQASTWMRGGALMVHLPGRGEFYLTMTPPAGTRTFRAAGWVDHEVLRFQAGSELVEIASKTNALRNADFGTVWILHTPPAGASERGVEFHCADNIEQLMAAK